MTEIIRVDIYNRDVIVHCGKMKPLRKYLSKFLSRDAVDEICEHLKDCSLGMTVQIADGGILVYMPHEPVNAKGLGVLVHELFHAAYFIMRKAGIDCNDSTDEAYAYLIEFLVEKAFSSLSVSPQRLSPDDASHNQQKQDDRSLRHESS